MNLDQAKWEAVIQHRKLSSVLCDDLEGWDRGGVRGMLKERIYIYIYTHTQLIHFVIQQKLTQNYKTIIL